MNWGSFGFKIGGALSQMKSRFGYIPDLLYQWFSELGPWTPGNSEILSGCPQGQN